MDRLEPDQVVDLGSGASSSERGTILGDGPRSPLTNELYQRKVREIQAASGEQRIELVQQFWREYPEVDVMSDPYELMGDAYSELGQPAEAARAWEAAVIRSWPAPDILALPLTNLQLPYEIGWAHYEAGQPALGADWLVRATFISDRPQLEQGLRFLHTALDQPGESFEGWYEERRGELAKRAPDFELPGYQTDTVRLSDRDARLTLINFWSPT